VIGQLEQRSLKADQETQKRNKTAVPALVVISCVFLLSVMIILLWTLRSKKPQAAVLSWCTADGCLEHAAVLTKSMDRSVQPCEDFYAYVCGNWKHGSLGIINISDAAGIVRARFQQANALMLFNGTSSLASFNRVAATFKSCIKRGNEDLPSNLRKLKSFMKARGIPWPYEAQGDRHPLDVLLDLDINWGLPDSLLAITFYNSAMKLLPMVCYYQIEQRYGAAMLTGYVDDRFPKSSQDLVTRLLTNIKQYVISKLGQKNSGAADRVRQLNFRLWPSKSLESSLNKAFPNQWSLYIDFWNQTLGTKGRLLGLPEYDDLYDLPGLFDPIVDYMPLGNKLSISLSALSSPFYYREGTMAINYGGLGWQVARTAFRAARGTLIQFVKAMSQAQRRSPRNKDKALASRDSKEMWYLTGIDIISLYQYYLSIYSLHVLELAALPFFSLDRSHFAKRGESFDNSSIL
ncbi:hypothetical protein HPB47_005505, partial [Ixodes persulcatus]